MKGISLMKLSSSRRSLRRPYTVLTGGKEPELKAGSSKATHMVFPASMPTPEFFHFPGGGGGSSLFLSFLVNYFTHVAFMTSSDATSSAFLGARS